jgi:hypothetical protein
LTNKTETMGVTETTDQPAKTSATNQPSDAGKKAFAEPEITAAVDILEATTFFQAATSGATN